MLQAQSIKSSDQRHIAVTNRNPHLPEASTPRANHLLAALPAEDYARLLPGMESVSLQIGQTVFDAQEREKYVYFPTEGIIAMSHTLADGSTAAFAIVGNEGAIGMASFLGGSNMPSQSLVMCSGHAYRLPANLMELEFKRSLHLRHLLLLHSQALITQIGQIVVCNRHHLLEQQLCHCILTFCDRLLSDDLKITQEQVAGMLGVRREGISEAVARLSRAGLICSGRGHIKVLDRLRLQDRACECYQVVRREYARLLRPSTQVEALFKTAVRKKASGQVLDCPGTAPLMGRPLAPDRAVSYSTVGK